MKQNIKTRFAPSPTGFLHLGHAYSILTAYQWAKDNNADFIIRMEDIDTTRCKPEYATAILQDLEWLGIQWSGDIVYQSQRLDIYHDALQNLAKSGLLYYCSCSRKDITNHPDTKQGIETLLYPKTCRPADNTPLAIPLNTTQNMRLKTNMCMPLDTENQLYFDDIITGKTRVDDTVYGDIVIARKDIQTSYHLSVVMDDALQGISHIIRGQDLLHQTHIHRLLQNVLDLPTPQYYHHKLIMDTNTGKKFSKSDNSVSLQYLRNTKGMTAENIKELLFTHP